MTMQQEAERKAAVMTYLREHPNSTARQVADAVLPGVDNRGFVVSGILRGMRDRGEVSYSETDGRGALKFRVKDGHP